MTILEKIEKQKEFVEKTSVIVDKLLNWQLDRLAGYPAPSKELLEKEWSKFINLVEKGQKDGIANGFFFYEQGRNVIETFRFFDDIVPEFKQLK